MKGTPRSLWLSMANRAANQAAGFWTGMFSAAAKRHQTALAKAMTKPTAQTQRKSKSKRP